MGKEEEYFNYESSKLFIDFLSPNKTYCGIYKITNNIDKKVYIGSSKNIQRRWKDHIKNLLLNKHHSSHFQNFYNKYLEVQFRLEILEQCKRPDLKIREQYYLDTVKPFGSDGFNMRKKAQDVSIMERNASKKKVYQYSLDGFKNEFNCASEAAKFLNVKEWGIVGCLLKRHKTSNGFVFSYNKLTQQEVANAYKDGRKNKNNCSNLPKRVKRTSVGGVAKIFETVMTAAKEMNISDISIRKACRNKTSYKNYYWEFLPSLRIKKQKNKTKNLPVGKFIDLNSEPIEIFKNIAKILEKYNFCRNALAKACKNGDLYKDFYWKRLK